jgi:hypothetical protein
MRQIDWDQPLSADDEAWLLQAGIQGTAGRIAANRAQFADVDDDVDTDDDGEDDGATLLVEDPAPVVDADGEATDDEDGDDYDEWTAADLRDECQKRDLTQPSKAKRAELIAALRAYDVEHAE